jgi:molybdopterin adenylyltransferase
VFQKDREDTAGPWLAERCRPFGEVTRACSPDEIEDIVGWLNRWVNEAMDVILTTGGTGLGPRDVTPEATRAVIERDVPGIAEALRHVSATFTPMGLLSRGLSGAKGQTLIINFPGSPRALEQLFPVVDPILPHATELLHGHTFHEKSPYEENRGNI